jgi:hypothetical protein
MTKFAGFLFFSLAMLGLFASPAQARSKRSTDVRIDEKQAGVLKVEAPRPHVTYVLLRARLDHATRQKPRQLVRKILDATRRAPF